MKLLFAIVNNDDSTLVSSGLMSEGFSVTKLATTGGFLMRGNTTFLIGTSDDTVDKAIDIISKFSKQRNQKVPASASFGMGLYSSVPIEVTVGGATVFVLDVERFEKL